MGAVTRRPRATKTRQHNVGQALRVFRVVGIGLGKAVEEGRKMSETPSGKSRVGRILFFGDS